MLIAVPCFSEYVVEYDFATNSIKKYEKIEVKRNLADVLREQDKKEQIQAIERALEKREHYKGAENLYILEVK